MRSKSHAVRLSCNDLPNFRGINADGELKLSFKAAVGEPLICGFEVDERAHLGASEPCE